MPLHAPGPSPHLPHQPRLLEVHEVAYQLRCSQETVRRLIRSGKLPAARLGSHFRVKQSDLDAFIDSLMVHIAFGERAIDRQLSEATTQLTRSRKASR
jgi:excisionase family DNA binding protein